LVYLVIFNGKQKMTKIRVLGLILLALLLTLSGCGVSQTTGGVASNSKAISPAGRPAPDFALKTPIGETVSLSSLKGRVVLINVWATTCPPCVQEMPIFESLQQDWQNRTDVKILMVDQGETADLVNRYVQSRGYTFTVLLDSDFNFALKYNIRYTPTTLLVDKEGLLRAGIIGPFVKKADILKWSAPYLN
jgi:thiol-disulfide isomerase/thioredoxin